METLILRRDVPMSVWIDNQHLVRQLVMAFNEQLPTGGTIAVQMTMQFSHYGRQPAPTLPPADQVGDLGGLLSAAQHSTSTGSATTAP